MSREEVETLLAVRRLVKERIERLSFELEVLRHALEGVKNHPKVRPSYEGEEKE